MQGRAQLLARERRMAAVVMSFGEKDGKPRPAYNRLSPDTLKVLLTILQQQTWREERQQQRETAA